MDAASREFNRHRAGNRCEYCHLSQNLSELVFHTEHIIPRQHGGVDDLGNVALACPDCNLLKGPNLTAIDPRTRKIVPLFHPRHDRWSEHFARRGPRLVGKTSIGRATVHLLKMNTPQRIRVRLLLL